MIKFQKVLKPKLTVYLSGRQVTYNRANFVCYSKNC